MSIPIYRQHCWLYSKLFKQIKKSIWEAQILQPSAPRVGLEPTTYRLTADRSTN